LETASRLFDSQGYDATDMKSIAAELGISVGTLYNYHASKPDLFQAVVLLWKEELTARMMARLDQDDSARSKLRAVLLMLYEDMEDFTGLWKEYLRSGARFSPDSHLGKRFKEDNQVLQQRIQDLLKEVWKNHPNAQPLFDDPDGRLGKLMVGSIMQLLMGGGSDREGNRAFVQHWINFIAPEQPAGKP